MTEAEIRALGAALEAEFDDKMPESDKDPHVTTGSFLFAHDGVASASRQLRRLASMSPLYIVEIGTGKGVGALGLSRVAEQVLTIDLGKYRLREAIWNWGVADNITQVLVPNNWQKQFLLWRWILADVAVIDGEHLGAGPGIDFEGCRHYRALLFHDYTPPHRNGVLELAERLEAEGHMLLRDPPFFWWSESSKTLHHFARIQ